MVAADVGAGPGGSNKCYYVFLCKLCIVRTDSLGGCLVSV